MRVFKPLQLSLQTKPFAWEGNNHLAVTLLLGFPFDRKQEVLLEQDLWRSLPDLLGDYAMLDIGMPKPQGEVLVYGKYYAPEGNAVTADNVQLLMGPVNKRLAIIGQRYWQTMLAPTEPEKFTEMPITYNNAFGGKDSKQNPTGKGMDEIDVFGEMRIPMPNIEDPDKLVSSTSHESDPAGFAPLDMMWEPRFSKQGTYDENWLQEYFPGYPPDLDWTHFNNAPEDQWIGGYWQGDESFKLLNMHPEKIEVGGSLPAFRARCFIEKQLENESLFSEVDMRAETTFLFPEKEIGVLLFRGAIEIEEDDATDIDHLLVAYEDLNQTPRSKEYYDEALRNRLDDRKTFKFMMYTKDIIPDSERCGFARMLDDVDMGGDSELAKNIDARAEAEKQKALDLLEEQKQKFITTLEKQNIDPTPYLKEFELNKDQAIDDPQLKAIMETVEQILPGSTKGDMSAIKAEEIDFSKFDEYARQMDELAASKLEQVKQKLRETIKNVEGTAAEEETRKKIEIAIKQMDELQPLPRPSADETIENVKKQLNLLEEAKERVRQGELTEDQLAKLDIHIDVDIEELNEKFQKGSAELKDLYRTGAHYVDGKPPHEVPIDIVQLRLKKAMEKGDSLAGGDWAGVDFSGLDLSGMDLSECYLEYTNFSNAKLCGANLSRVIMTHADLTNADLTGAIMDGCNLGASQLNATIISNVDFGEGVLSKSDLNNAKFINCDLREVNFLDATMTGVSMTECNLMAANFLKMDFTGAHFIDCELIQCNFIQSQLERCNFSNSNLSTSNFVECTLDNSVFTKADMTNVRFPGGCSLKHCNFDEATLDRASFRSADAEGSRFEKATFHMADFGSANLQKTNFYGAEGKHAMFMKADLANADFSSVNLMEGSLMKARLTSADLSYSNLYSVEFMGATVGDTDFYGANLDMTRLEDWRPSR